MTCRGVHFGITPEMVERLLTAKNDDELLEIIQEEIEEPWDKEWLRESDKAWDAIHRCFAEGKLDYNYGSFPLNACILGGEQLYEGDDYIISLVRPDKVGFVAEALQAVTKKDMREKYFNLDRSDYGGAVSEEDFTYTWHWFTNLPELFLQASRNGRAIIFTVDQ